MTSLSPTIRPYRCQWDETAHLETSTVAVRSGRTFVTIPMTPMKALGLMLVNWIVSPTLTALAAARARSLTACWRRTRIQYSLSYRSSSRAPDSIARLMVGTVSESVMRSFLTSTDAAVGEGSGY